MRASKLAFLAAALLLVRLSAAAGAEDAPDAEACLACHGIEGFSGSADEPLFVDAEKFASSTHGSFDCTVCHDDATEMHEPDLKPVGLDACAVCHEDSVAAYRGGVHGAARFAAVAEAASCTDCHGNIHQVISHTEAESPVHRSQQAATCARCHADVELARKYAIPVVRPAEAYLKSAHARAVAEGRHGATCTDCHRAHDILPGSVPTSSIFRDNVPATCGACHREIQQLYEASVHGEALRRGHRAAPECADCHGEHRILGASEPSSPVFAANLTGDTCGRCHADARFVEKYGFAAGAVSAFDDSFHGLALRAGKLNVANCASCHGVHDIRPPEDPRSHVHPDNLPATCGKCHPGAGKTFALGPVHGLGGSTGRWLAGWVRTIYLSLIILTIGGMVVHNLLDLSHKMRHPEPPPPPVPAGHPPRMTRTLRWQHGLTMGSFTVLVWSGFALTYPESWWATPLVGLWPGLDVRGLVHRGAAIVMLAALGWHLLHLALSPRLRAVFRGIVPEWRDVQVLIGTLAYYVGRRERRPRSGTFNYAEKAEYWAFLWGSAVMAITGFTLWFQNLTLAYLPGWVPDVATAIHFYEAVLATLAIVVWHFYWVIFDPEVYPMDRSWWSGQSPASRVHERVTEAEEDEGVPPTDGSDK
jgi:cytochrome b subunit of formate dehydrogenase